MMCARTCTDTTVADGESEFRSCWNPQIERQKHEAERRRRKCWGGGVRGRQREEEEKAADES